MISILIFLLSGNLYASTQVATPGGFRPSNTIHRVEAGETIHPTDAVSTLYGNSFSEDIINSISFPATLTTGWITYTGWEKNTPSPLTFMRTEWRVPAAPEKTGSQLIYYFNGIEHHEGKLLTILQPVLQYGVSPAGGGAYWAVASWYVTNTGQSFHTDLTRVNPGDTVVGTMKLTKVDGDKFSYASEFEGTDKSKLSIADIGELTWANETLEAYGIDDCKEYSSDSVQFRNIRLESGGGIPEIGWIPTAKATDCGQHAVVVNTSGTDGDVELFTH